MNIKDIIPSGLYKCTQPKKYYRGGIPGNDEDYRFLYHCRNWTFRPHTRHDGKIIMCDTYFDNKEIEITDKNMADFELVFDFNDVVPCRENEMDEYEEKDIYKTATDSGGYTCGKGRFWKKKDAKRSKEKLIDKYKQELHLARQRIEHLEAEIEQIQSGGERF